jgi:hypothetical protein
MDVFTNKQMICFEKNSVPFLVQYQPHRHLESWLKHPKLMVNQMEESESKKHGEPRNQVPEEGSESEEGWHEFLEYLLNFYLKVLVSLRLFNNLLENRPDLSWKSQHYHIYGKISWKMAAFSTLFVRKVPRIKFGGKKELNVFWTLWKTTSIFLWMEDELQNNVYKQF